MEEPTQAVRAGGNRMTVFGIIAIILGVLAMLAPVVTGLSIALALGVLVVVAGIVRILWAFHAGSFGRGLLMFAIGGLTALCGIALLAHPLLTTELLTILLAAYFILDGVVELAAGFQLKQQAGRGWFFFGGVVSIALGAMLWTQFPLSGAWAMGILLGIKLLFIGMIMISGGSGVRAFTDSEGAA